MTTKSKDQVPESPSRRVGTGRDKSRDLRVICKKLWLFFPSYRVKSKQDEADKLYGVVAKHLRKKDGHYWDVSFEEFWAALRKTRREMIGWASKDMVYAAYNGTLDTKAMRRVRNGSFEYLPHFSVPQVLGGVA